MSYPLHSRRSVSIDHSVSFPLRNPRRSSLLLIGAVALLSACEEPNPVDPASEPTSAQLTVTSNSIVAKACQKNGWQGLVTSTGTAFASEDACVSYGARGGVLYQQQSITFAALAAKSFGDADFTVSATASSGLTVTFTASGSCTVTGTTVHLTGGGQCAITAHQAGNATWFAAPDVVRSFAIAKATQTVAFTSTNPSYTLKSAPTYTPAAKATSGLAAAITLDATSTGCSLSNGAVTFTGAGVCVIDANQVGDDDWKAAAPTQQSITVYGCIDTEALLRYAASVGGDYEFCGVGTKIVLTGGEVGVGTTLSLTGVGGANAVIDANKTGRVFNNFGNLTLRDVTVTGGQVTGTFTGNGGGILVNSGSVVLKGNTAIDGNAALDGGGVRLEPGTTLTMNDASTVSNNSATTVGNPGIATGFGGGIDVKGATLIMNGTSTVRKNLAAGSNAMGGGVLMNVGSLTMNGSSAITENSTGPVTFPGTGTGGGVYFVNGGSLTLNGSASITGNSAVADGGGIYRVDGGFGTIAGVTATNVTSNTPNNCGGPAAVAGCVP
jgi:hypothetical protein